MHIFSTLLFVHRFALHFAVLRVDTLETMSAESRGRGRPPKSEDYEPRIRTMMRLAPDLYKALKTAVRKKKARSANAYIEAALREKMIADGLIKPPPPAQ
jgi:hypothetical protein